MKKVRERKGEYGGVGWVGKVVGGRVKGSWKKGKQVEGSKGRHSV